MGSSWSDEDEAEGSELSKQKNQIHSTLEAQRFKNPGVSILQEILRRIKLNEDLITENNEILGEFLKSFVDKLKEEDNLFKFLLNKLDYTGSFYSGLRISMPDEFDINIVLKFPFKESEFEVIHQPNAPSFVKFRLKNHDVCLKNFPAITRNMLFDADGYLIPQKIRNWLQSIFDKALKGRVKAKQAGPARTLILPKMDVTQIDIDLVPVVSRKFFLPHLDAEVKYLVGDNLEAYLVPKPITGIDIPVEEARRLWRVHFPEPEKIILHDKGCAKSVIRLLKFLRDKEDRKILASYYLNTVVMWMISKNEGKKDYWKEDKMDERFLEALQELDNAVSKRKIAYLFHKDYNLLEKLNYEQAINIHKRLEYFIKNIKKNPRFLWKMFQEESSFLDF